MTPTIRTTATSPEAFTRSHGYDGNGRPSRTTHPSGLSVSYEYNARGYLSNLKRGSAALVTYAGMDAWGNTTRETYGNGVTTARTFDAATGRATGIGTAQGTTAFQDETYAWRSDGLLGRRAKGADREDFAYDLLGRLTGAEAYLDGSRTAGRTLAYGYDALGNLTSKTSDAAGDADAASYAYGTGSTAPTRLASAVLGGRATTFAYDADGHVTRRDAATGDDAFIEWNGRGLPSRITVGATAADAAPKARDEFRYGPAGERYHRRITWEETLADGTSRTRTAEAYRVGAYERVVGDAHAAHARVEKTHVGPALEVRTSATSSAPVFEYVHADHLGSAAAVTDASGAELLTLAHDPYGTRRRADWTAQLPAAEVAALAAGQDAGRARSGFTGHEPLDRTGFVHMNGRLYDPRVGRFLSPDPIVSEPWSGQGWNPYSYVGNSPLSRTDPTGYCYNPRYPCPMHANQGGGFASGTATLLSRSLSWRVPIVLTVHWGPVSFGIGWGGFLNGGDDGGGYFGSFFGGFYRPYVSVGFGAPYPVVTSTARTVALGQEPVPADGPMALEPIVDIAADVGEWVFDFLIWDTVETGMQTYEDFRVGNYGDAAFGVVLTACDVVKACKIGGKLVKRVPGVERFGGWIRGKPGMGRVELDASSTQIGGKYGRHYKTDRVGYRSPAEYRQRAEDILNDPKSKRTVYSEGPYAGETHYELEGELLRLDPDGAFRSLYVLDP